MEVTLDIWMISLRVLVMTYNILAGWLTGSDVVEMFKQGHEPLEYVKLHVFHPNGISR
jgi:hypothetical protein